jgi:hypothetical protein
MISKELLYSGQKYDIYVIKEGGYSEVLEFMAELRVHQEAEFNKLAHSLDFLKDHGPPTNKEKFNNEGDGIYAVKTKSVRIYGFFHGPRCFVLAVGALKNQKGGKKVERRNCAKALELSKAPLI